MTRKTQVSTPPLSAASEAIARTLAAGRSYHGAGNLNAAEKCYRQVLAADSENVDGLHLLGVVAFQSDHAEEGIALIKRAARKKPRDPSILVNLGAAYRKAKRSAEARDTYKAAIKLKPDLWEAYFNLGKALLDLEDFKGAVAAYEKCLEIKPEDAEALVNLGNVHKLRGDVDAALACYERALQVSENMSEAYGNIASVFIDNKWFHAALAVMDKGLALDPRPGQLRFKRGVIALRVEKFSSGWADYESRHVADDERVPRPSAPPPYWAGEDLTGKTLLIGTEQGIGDEILYASMIPDAIARAGRCIIESSPRMQPVFARSFPTAIVKQHPEKFGRATPASEVDYQIQAPGLGQFFRTDRSHFPTVKGYLKADAARAADLRARYQAIQPGNIVVGISWRSQNDRGALLKSAETSDWKAIFAVPGVTFVNLQYGNCDGELADVRREFGVQVYQDREIDPFKSMDDFFSQVAAMDLVITTSNTTVHTAGSLNIPTWLMLSAGPVSLWYWFVSGDSSPWYPSVEIFRAPVVEGAHGNTFWKQGDALWKDTFERAAQRLAALVRDNKASPRPAMT